MSADLLREAAAKMRERATGATPGPWETKGNSVRTVAVSARPEYGGFGLHDDVAHLHMTTGNFQSEVGNAEHIASWHPAVALAVADWLEAEARYKDGDLFPTVHRRAALAAADAYLGRHT